MMNDERGMMNEKHAACHQSSCLPFIIHHSAFIISGNLMHKIKLIALTALFVFTLAAPSHAHTFGWRGEQFLLDGKPFQIIAGDMHYARVPRQYWRDRMRKMKAMG